MSWLSVPSTPAGITSTAISQDGTIRLVGTNAGTIYNYNNGSWVQGTLTIPTLTGNNCLIQSINIRNNSSYLILSDVTTTTTRSPAIRGTPNIIQTINSIILTTTTTTNLNTITRIDTTTTTYTNTSTIAPFTVTTSSRISTVTYTTTYYNSYIYFSTDGQTWTSDITYNIITPIISLFMSQNKFGYSIDSTKIYKYINDIRSTNTVLRDSPLDITESYTSIIASSDDTIILATTNNYPYISIDSGTTWTKITQNNSTNWISSAISSNNNYIVILSSSGLIGVYDNTTWRTSIILQQLIISPSVATSITITSDGATQYVTASTGELYKSTDYGSTWNQVPTTNNQTNWSNLILSGPAGNNTGLYAISNNLLYAFSNQSCYHEDTEILTDLGYVPIKNLKENDSIITYPNNEPKKIKYIIKGLTSFSKNVCNCMYKLNDSNLMILGGHAILVDELTDQEKINMARLTDSNFVNKIEDKYLLLAAASDKFTKIETDEVFRHCHIVLENDDELKHYGIYANNILSETMSEKVYNRLRNI